MVRHEQEALSKSGHGNLAYKVAQVSVTQGDGLGSDVLSFSLKGEAKYIEVKTTAGPPGTGFFVTENQVEFSRQNARNFYLFPFTTMTAKRIPGSSMS